MTSDQTPGDARIALRNLFDDHFDLSDLRTLTFELGINYGNIAGETQRNKFEYLIWVMGRDNRLGELLERAAAINPGVSWPEGDWSEVDWSEPPDTTRWIIVPQSTIEGIEALPPETGDPPFKGLDYFHQRDAGLFFGRDQLIGELVDALHDAHHLAVVGASGSGKSSLVRAGMVPVFTSKFTREGILPPSGRWTPTILTPTVRPFDSLAAALFPEDIDGRTAFRHRLEQRPLALAALLRERAISQKRRQLLIVDQFEELFTLTKKEDARARFVEQLVRAIDPKGAVGRVVLTLRADFYADCLRFKKLKPILENQQIIIGGMSRDELREAILEPAVQGGWKIQEGLVELMLDEVADEPGALPLLSHALRETWERRRGRTLTLSGYREAGGVRGAIANTAEATYTALSPQQQTIARRIFLDLTELGEGTQDTRRRARPEELVPQREDPEQVADVIRRLAAARLVTVDDDSVEVAHEALIREWPALRRWLDDNREGLRLQRRLAAAAAEWQGHNEDPGYLYTGGRLSAAEEWLQGAGSERLTDLESRFVVASRAERERLEQEAIAQKQRQEQLAEQRRAAALRGRLAAGLGVAALVLIVASILLFNQRQAATRAQATAESAQSTAEYLEGLAVDEGAQAREAADLAQAEQATAEAAADLARTEQAAAEAARGTAVAESTQAVEAANLARDERATAVAESTRAGEAANMAQTREAAAVSAEGTAAAEIIALDQARLLVQAGELTNASQLARAQNNETLALLLAVAAMGVTDEPLPAARQALLDAVQTSGRRNDTLIGFQVRRGNGGGNLTGFGVQPGQGDEVGRLTGLTVFDGVDLFPLCVTPELICDGNPDGQPLIPLDDRGLRPLFSEDGRFMVLPNGETITVRELIEAPFDGETFIVPTAVLRFSPGGDILAAAGDNRLVLAFLKETLSQTDRVEFELDTIDLVSIAVSSDGRRVATAWRDRLVVWEVNDNRLGSLFEWPLNRSDGELAFSHSGRWLAVTALMEQSNTVTLLDLSAGDPLGASANLSAGGPSRSLTFTTSEERFAALTGSRSSQDDTVSVWEIEEISSGEIIEPLVLEFKDGPGLNGVRILPPIFTPDGRYIVTSIQNGDDSHNQGRVHLWPVSVEGQIAEACRLAGRPLTADERQQYLAALPELQVCEP